MTNSSIDNLGRESIQRLLSEWEGVYCQLSKKEKEEIHIKQFRWHVFSSEKYSSLNGDEAISEYNKKISREYYVIPEVNVWPDKPAFVTETLPQVEKMIEIGVDYYVFPKNLAWTMVFTHEYPWLGPYFSKHENYKKLNSKNIQSVRAKDSGW